MEIEFTLEELPSDIWHKMYYELMLGIHPMFLLINKTMNAMHKDFPHLLNTNGQKLSHHLLDSSEIYQIYKHETLKFLKTSASIMDSSTNISLPKSMRYTLEYLQCKELHWDYHLNLHYLHAQVLHFGQTASGMNQLHTLICTQKIYDVPHAELALTNLELPSDYNRISEISTQHLTLRARTNTIDCTKQRITFKMLHPKTTHLRIIDDGQIRLSHTVFDRVQVYRFRPSDLGAQSDFPFYLFHANTQYVKPSAARRLHF